MPTTHYEKGPYKAVVCGQRFDVTPNKTPYLAIEFEPTQATGSNEFPATVYKRELTLYFSEKAAPYSIDNLRRMGWSGTKLQELDPTNEGYDDLSGTEIDVVCDRNDKGYEDWNLQGPGGSPKESKPAVAKKLDALFGKALKSSVPKSEKKTVEQELAAVADEDDDVPF